MGDMAEDGFEDMGPCRYCIDAELFRTQPLDDFDDCALNPDEYSKCPLIREAHGLPPLDQDEE